MTEKPIIFNTEMVRAILDGRKTQTRRPIKPQPSSGIRTSVFVKSGIEDGHGREIKPPYQIGDTLYARETFSFLPSAECGSFCNGPCSGYYKNEYGCYVYRTDYGTTEDDSFPPSMFKWHPSIHMPKEAARIRLKVTGVKPERVQEISIQDAISEGVFQNEPAFARAIMRDCHNQNLPYAVANFAVLWDSIYSARGYGWDENPYVWKISFERVEKT
jgi:hypothetical protein